jgi:type II secretory pathway pseudopilin PulG
MKQQKGEAELLSYIIVVLISIGIIALIMTGIIPAIEKNKSKQNFELSKNYIDLIDQKITKVLSSPIDSTDKLSLNLTDLYLTIDSNNQTIEIYHIISGEYYKDTLKSYEGRKYIFRDKQKLYVGIKYDDINITTHKTITNQTIDLYFTKIGKNQIRIDTELINVGN